MGCTLISGTPVDELMDNQLVFTRLGFVKTVEFSHPGYTQITEVTMQEILATTKLT